MTDKTKPEELNDTDLGNVTGGVGGLASQPQKRMEIVNEDELVSTRKPGGKKPGGKDKPGSGFISFGEPVGT